MSFLSTWNKSPLKLPDFFFHLPWRKTCKIRWKKIMRIKRGGKKNSPLRSQSADLLYLRKKEITLLEADVDTVSVTKDGKSYLNHCSSKKVLMAVTIPVIDHLHSRQDSRKAEPEWDQDWNQPANFNIWDTNDSVLFCGVLLYFILLSFSFLHDKRHVFQKT